MRNALLVILSSFRPHQWAKNLLVFVPLLTSFRLGDIHAVQRCALAFAAFCLCASGSYVLNDFLDREADRAHPRKRRRPIASGAFPAEGAVVLALTTMISGLLVAADVSVGVLRVLFVYSALATLYSFFLKRAALVDVLVLAWLYTLRLEAGCSAAGVPASGWLLAFSAFTFLSLALMKRCAEVSELGDSRGYRRADLPVLWSYGWGCSIFSVATFSLFAQSAASDKYASPAFLSAVAVVLFHWQFRMWLKAARGEMADDPLVFAATDFGSVASIALMIGLTILGYFF